MSEPTRADARERRQRARVYLLANAFLLALIVFMINYLAFRHYERWDWTEESIFTLSDRSERVLARMSRQVDIWVLLSESEPEHAELRNLLERYRAASRRIALHYVDPHADPGEYEAALRRLNVGMSARETRDGVVRTADVAVVVVAGDRRWEIGREDLVSHTLESENDEERVQLNVEAERALTGAIVEVLQGEPTKVCFVTGHGEMSLEDAALGGLAGELRRENLEPESIALTRPRDALDACQMIAVIGPELAFDENATRALREYAQRGGNLLFALDPIPDPAQRRVLPTGLEDMLRDFGIQVDRDLVVEPDPEHLPAGPGHPVGFFVVDRYGEHAVTEPFQDSGFPLLVSEARSVRPIGERADVLIRASDASYGETDLTAFAQGELGEVGADDIRGPISIGVAGRVEVTGQREEESEEEPTGGRIVVLGDAAMLTTQFLSQNAAANRAFVGPVFGWLTQREALISIPPRSIDMPGIPTEDDVDNLWLRVVVFIPLAFVLLGFAVWWNRRN
jgi:hypothetical protein